MTPTDAVSERTCVTCRHFSRLLPKGHAAIPLTTAEAFHPSVFILEELDARGWTLDDLARRMGGDFGTQRLALDFYLLIGPEEPMLRLGDPAALGRAFDVDPALFTNLERAWLEPPSIVALAAAVDAKWKAGLQ